MLTITDKDFNIEVNTPNATTTKFFELDKTFAFVKACAVVGNGRDDLPYYRGKLRLEINKEEVFVNYHARMLMSSLSVAMDGRFYTFSEPIPVGNAIIKVEYTDRTDGRTLFEPYVVTIYLKCKLQ